MNYFFLVLFILGGLLNLLAAIFNWDWYFSLWRAKRIVDIFGRTIARIMHGLLGIFIILLIIFTNGNW